MDSFAVQSLTRAQHAIASAAFVAEIAPVTIQTRKGEQVFAVDEQPGNAKVDKIPTLRPAFAKTVLLLRLTPVPSQMVLQLWC